MKIETPLQAEHQLAGQFEHWRQNRCQPRDPIPQPLWDQAVALTAVLPYIRVAKQLRLSPHDLKKHMAAQSEPSPMASLEPLGFVEVPLAPPQPQAPLTTEIELTRRDGSRLRLMCSPTPEPLAAVVRAFMEVS